MSIQGSVQVSPKYDNTKIGPGCQVEDKIDVFEDGMNGWILQHAHALCDAKYVFRNQTMFAVLILATTYFEPIESYHTGKSSKGQSKVFFRRGFLRVFVNLSATLAAHGSSSPDALAEEIADEIYEQLRCGLFHEGGTKHKLLIREDTAPLGFVVDISRGHVGWIIIDPLKFLMEIQHHLNLYVGRLRDQSQTDLRQKFEKFFNQKFSSANQTPLPPPVTAGP